MNKLYLLQKLIVSSMAGVVAATGIVTASAQAATITRPLSNNLVKNAFDIKITSPTDNNNREVDIEISLATIAPFLAGDNPFIVGESGFGVGFARLNPKLRVISFEFDYRQNGDDFINSFEAPEGWLFVGSEGNDRDNDITFQAINVKDGLAPGQTISGFGLNLKRKRGDKRITAVGNVIGVVTTPEPTSPVSILVASVLGTGLLLGRKKA